MPPAEATTPLPRMTREEYLAFEETSEGKHEFHAGKLLAMSGSTHEHARIATNVNRSLGNRLEGGACDVLDSTMRVRAIALDRFVYPDGTVHCGPPEFDVRDQKKLALLNPILIVEVLSESTEHYDRGDKFALYRTIPSFREYVLVSQNEPQVETFFRTEDGNWRIEVFAGIDAVVPLHSVGIELPLAEVYRNVPLPE